MKKVLLICGALALSGCNAQWGQIAAGVGNVLGSANNVLADLAENSIPKACGIIRVADGYFQRLSPKISADKIAIEAKAMASVNVICNNPPKDITAAFNTLVDLWFVIQDATKTN
ncbi:MAG: hypothetical protein VW684_11495 [Betaproteobacteria bacterium]|jgi:hypothetical protein